MPEADSWKDDFIVRQEISVAEFNSLQPEQQKWLLDNKHIFYNDSTTGILKNLLHHRNKALADKLRPYRWR